SRVVSQKVNFLGQGNKGGLISSAVRRRTGEYPPARLLLPGGLEPRDPTTSMGTSMGAGPLREWLLLACLKRRIHSYCRSEEHTSELQSLTNLVCRPLLEKKTASLRKLDRICERLHLTADDPMLDIS